MSQTETFNGNRYEIVAWARGQRVLYYVEFGSYQGEWLLVARDNDQYYVYKDYYGSCSGCDSYEASFGYSDPPTMEAAQEFAANYPAFLEIPRATMRNLAEAGTVRQVLPANIRDLSSDIDFDEAAREIQTIAKLEEGAPITVADVLETRNQETKRRALDAYGHERFATDAGAEEIARDGADSLLRVGDHVFLNVKDSSTERRYLLRVPPTSTSVLAAKAWTFNLTAEQYRPLVET